MIQAIIEFLNVQIPETRQFPVFYRQTPFCNIWGFILQKQSRSGLYIYRERSPASTFNSEGVACYSSSRISIHIEILRIYAVAVWIFEPKKRSAIPYAPFFIPNSKFKDSGNLWIFESLNLWIFNPNRDCIFIEKGRPQVRSTPKELHVIRHPAFL